MKRCSSRRIILASNSPRRQELLRGLDIDFTVDTGNCFEESISPDTPPGQVPVEMSTGKSHGFHRALEDDEVLITSDTVVVTGGVCLGKPHGREEAVRMLEMLSGRTHEVVTAVTIRDNTKERTFADVTKVSFRVLDRGDIEYYVDRYRPFDKAGAYGIQEWIGYAAISGIEGSFYTVMGLPVHLVYEALQEFMCKENEL